MPYLTKVEFVCLDTVCDDKILLLALMKSLAVLEFTDRVPRGQVSIQNMAFVADKLNIALHNPHAALILARQNVKAGFAVWC